MNVMLLDSKDWEKLDQSKITRQEIAQTVGGALEEAGQTMHDLSPHLSIVIKPNLPYDRDEAGVGCLTHDPELISVTFDPGLEIEADELRAALRKAILLELRTL